MEQIILYIILIVAGLCMGSFAGASTWRLRAYQLKQQKNDGEKINQKEYDSIKKLIDKPLLKDRSQCLNCSYILKWYDLIPLVSWISLRGRCRKCHKKIGFMEPLIEIGVVLFFVLSYMFWPYSLINGFEIARFIIWLVSGVGFAILFTYDAKWFLLPNKLNLFIICLGAISAALYVLGSSDYAGAILGLLGSMLVLSGFYLVLYLISHGKWIGFGDVKLCLALALLLADWKLAFIALFMANFIGCLVVLPGIVTGKLKRNSHVPFGPLLIIGAVIAELAGSYMISLFTYGMM